MTRSLNSIIENIKIATDLSQDGICITDNSGTIVYANDSLAAQLGYSTIELIGNPRDVLLNITEAVEEEVSDISDQFDDHKIIKLSSPRSALVFAFKAEKKIFDNNHEIIAKLESFRFNQPPTINKNVLNILYGIGQLPLGTKDLEQLFSEIQLLVSSVLYAKNLYVFLLDKDKELDLVYFEDHAKRDASRLIEITDIAKLCIKGNTPTLLNSVQIKELVDNNKIRIDSDLPLYAMCAPLKVKNTIIGVIATQIFNSSYSYSKIDLQLLSYASNQIAIAIEEARITRTLNKTLDDIINIIEAIPYGIVLVSENNQIELINDTALELLDVSPSDPLDKINKELFTESPDGFCILKPSENGKPIEIQQESRGGKTQNLLKTTKQISFNKKNVFLESFVDISELKAAQELINRLSQTVYQSTNSIIITNKEGFIEFVNPKFTEMKGFTSEEIIGKHVGITQSRLNDDSVFKELWEVVSSGNQWESAVYSQTKAGEVFYERTRVSPIISKEGETNHYLFVGEDISDQIKAEEELKDHVEELEQNQKVLEENGMKLAITNAKLAESEELLQEENASKDKFFSIISHDLKSPLSGLLGLSEMLIEDYNEFDDEERKDHLRMLNKSANKMHGLLESLLHWARAQSDRLECVIEEINLDDIFNELFPIYESTAEKKQIKLSNKITEQFDVYADRNILSTILRNLISNAIKFTKAKGNIEFNAELNDDLVTISISDSGIGMSEEDQNKIFKIDTHHSKKGTNNEDGTGLGLILCKELAEKLDGSIWVTSQLNVGSTFSFTVPAKID